MLKSVPRVGSILWVHPAQLRWTHDKNQCLFTCGRRLEDVVTDLRRGILLPSDLRMIEVVHWESKWSQATIEGSGVSERLLSSRCRSAWG